MTTYLDFMKHANKVAKRATSSRPILQGVHHKKDGGVIVTDSHRLYSFSGGINRDSDVTLHYKDGRVLDGNYPETSKLFPDLDGAEARVELINLPNFAAACKLAENIEKLERKMNGRYNQAVRIVAAESSLRLTSDPSYDMAFDFKVDTRDVVSADIKIAINPQYLSEAAALLKDSGDGSATLYYFGLNRPVVLKTDDLDLLILPIKWKEA